MYVYLSLCPPTHSFIHGHDPAPFIVNPTKRQYKKIRVSTSQNPRDPTQVSIAIKTPSPPPSLPPLLPRNAPLQIRIPSPIVPPIPITTSPLTAPPNILRFDGNLHFAPNRHLTGASSGSEENLIAVRRAADAVLAPAAGDLHRGAFGVGVGEGVRGVRVVEAAAPGCVRVGCREGLVGWRFAAAAEEGEGVGAGVAALAVAAVAVAVALAGGFVGRVVGAAAGFGGDAVEAAFQDVVVGAREGEVLFGDVC